MSPATPSRGPQALESFLDLSAAVGQDILKTQGAGGNTSIKQDGILWVKASGTWLAHAKERNIMVPVEIAPLVKALRQGDPRAEKATDFVVAELNESGLRPSIETSFHAALEQPVVAHFHCVNTIALAVSARREQLLAKRMSEVSDLTWKSIPYRRPGTPLAGEIDRVASERPDVLVLFNHGLIVCGDTVEEVSERIERVTSALSTAPRETPEADRSALEAVCHGSGFRPAEDAESHKVALCPVSRAIAMGGSLYPDHVIFLGTKLGVLAEGQTVEDLLQGFKRRGEAAPKMIIVPGKGVLLSTDLTAGGEAMARCLAEVTLRIPADEEIVYLSAADEAQLTNWEAEQYRQALDRKSAGR
ncbi:class II aldolase/adducin family protein [Sinorhizobium sp. BG8]|uniref:class II aldolase/adducin family protein n=1 Tax=Sinorhizobium sp. BG8 TaxID=2613773 RepID=UPI00193E5B0A|nr:class II aldolase/adducin family protein [Sinorhizobium sp. BG8]QRM57375.1 class II aldolase [Sinorhizobium sp. BG8]